MAVVREDTFGLYVKYDGNIYRPQDNHRYMTGGGKNTSTKCKKGDKAKCRRLAGVLWAWVNDEYWFYHGSYIGKNEPSENFWHRR